MGDWYANVAFFDAEDGVDSEDFELAYIRYLHLLWEAQDFLTSRGAEPKDVIVLMRYMHSSILMLTDRDSLQLRIHCF